MGLYSMQCMKWRMPCICLSLHACTPEPVGGFRWYLMWVCWVNFSLVRYYHLPALHKVHTFILSFILLITVHQIIRKEFKIKLLLVKLFYLVYIFLYSGLYTETEQKDCCEHAWFYSESLWKKYSPPKAEIYKMAPLHALQYRLIWQFACCDDSWSAVLRAWLQLYLGTNKTVASRE
jgi:hypothetical protein